MFSDKFKFKLNEEYFKLIDDTVFEATKTDESSYSITWLDGTTVKNVTYSNEQCEDNLKVKAWRLL